MLKLLLLTILACAALGCGQLVEQDSKDLLSKNVKMRPFMEGKHLYRVHCAACHKKDGKGQGRMYPPLAGSDYMQKNNKQLPCIIKNGIEGEIVVNDTTYNIKMLGVKQLNPLQVADLIYYINNAWENDYGDKELSEEEIKTQLKHCQ